MEDVKDLLQILSLILGLLAIVLTFVLKNLFKITNEVSGISIWIGMSEKTYSTDRKDILSRIQRLESTYIRDRRKSDMRYTLAFLMVFSFGVVNAQATDYTLGAPAAYDITTAQDWFQTDDGEDQAAFGICYGPFYEIKNKKGKKVAELFRACGYYGQSIDATQKEFATGAVQLFEFAGLIHGAIGMNNQGKTVFGWGVSLDKLWRQLPNRPENIQMWPANEKPENRRLSTR